jgi:hypothetical protein
MTGASARDLNRRLLSALRRAERRTGFAPSGLRPASPTASSITAPRGLGRRPTRSIFRMSLIRRPIAPRVVLCSEPTRQRSPACSAHRSGWRGQRCDLDQQPKHVGLSRSRPLRSPSGSVVRERSKSSSTIVRSTTHSPAATRSSASRSWCTRPTRSLSSSPTPAGTVIDQSLGVTQLELLREHKHGGTAGADGRGRRRALGSRGQAGDPGEARRAHARPDRPAAAAKQTRVYGLGRRLHLGQRLRRW